MHITRRTFLHTAMAAGFTFAVVGNGNSVFGQKADPELFPIPVEVYSQPLYSVTARQFERWIGRNFTVTSPDGRVETVVLTQVNTHERLGNTTRGYYGESFSLSFQSKAKSRSPLTQELYTLAGNGFDFELLVVPVGIEKGQFEVVINHLSS